MCPAAAPGHHQPLRTLVKIQTAVVIMAKPEPSRTHSPREGGKRVGGRVMQESLGKLMGRRGWSVLGGGVVATREEGTRSGGRVLS